MKKPIVRLLAAALLLAGAGCALAGVHYVDGNSTNATAPYTNWSTACVCISGAADAAVAGDEVVVTNGTYGPVVVNRPLSIRSVNGPQCTVIDAAYSARCVTLTDGASLSGFCLTRGYIEIGDGEFVYGAGVYGGTLNNCTLTDNSISASILYPLVGTTAFGLGGGAVYCTLNNCTLTDNSVSATCFENQGAFAVGGGAYYCTLNNSMLIHNWVSASRGSPPDLRGPQTSAEGGGAFNCTLNNCTLTGNWANADDVFPGGDAIADGGGASSSTLNNCTLVGNGANAFPGNLAYGGGAHTSGLKNCISFSNYSDYGCEDCGSPGILAGDNWFGDPLFVAGSLRLQPNSPCVNAGNNSYVTTATDLDGNPRISGGTVDIGAYEFQFNHAPLALGTVSPLFAIPQGGTNRFILSPNNADAAVVLDGSQSSDADNDPLQFSWYADGQPNALATGALATHQFAVGPHTVQLVVSDGHGTATAQVSFDVITPATAVSQLMAVVGEANLDSRDQQPLLATLSAAMSAFDRGDFKAGVNQLSAFQNQVRAQIARWNPALAGEWITATQRISEVVGGG